MSSKQRQSRIAAGLALGYGAGAAAHRAVYGKGLLRRVRLDIPVVSVGGLLLGGSGKTPVAREVASLIRCRGLRVAIVCRAYRGTQREPARVLSSDWFEPEALRRFGDEALLHARWSAAIDVYCAAEKWRAAVAAREAGAEVIVVDDGFQHHRLHRDLDIVVTDGADAALPPLGDARERPGAVDQADLVWLHRRAGDVPVSSDRAIVSTNTPTTVVDRAGVVLCCANALRGKRVGLVAGVARPEDFRDLLRRVGARIVAEHYPGDHRSLTDRALRELRRAQPELLICTEKDLARNPRPIDGLYALRCRARIVTGALALERRLDRVLERRQWR